MSEQAAANNGVRDNIQLVRMRVRARFRLSCVDGAMSRPPRAFVAGYPVHLVHRGNDRQPIFRCDADFRYLWRSLKEVTAETGLAINAYVFMTNHIHLLVTPSAADAISRTMHCVSRRYAGYFNVRYGRTGTLWEGRYRASMITQDRHFLACHRYIDMNPVRARIASRPEEYAWSSHRFYALGETNSLITPHSAVLAMGSHAAARCRAYVALFETELDAGTLEEIRRSARSSRPMGTAIRVGHPHANRP